MLLALAPLRPATGAEEPGGPLPGADRAAERLAGLPATLVLGDPVHGRVLLRLNPEHAAERASPCSTFKIPNTLIALEAGAVTLEDSHLPRDPAKAPARDWWPAHWDRDHDLASALRGSVVWYFQELARRVGEEAMQRRLDGLGYGNRDLSGGIDRFWLSSTLAISADEQVALLGRLLSDGAGFAPEHRAALREPLLVSEGHGWTWYGKTGSCTLPEPSGEGTAGAYELPEEARWTLWLVGWVEGPAVPDGLRTYAFRVEADSYREGYDLRDELTRRLLVDLDLLDEGILAPLEE